MYKNSVKIFLLLAFFGNIGISSFANTPTIQTSTIKEKLAALETSADGQIGISAVNTANNMQLEYRANQRFPFCSTAKFIVASAILKKSMNNPDLLQQKLHFKKTDLSYSPITKNHLADGMTISELCAAAITYSDNTAMNILVKHLGGPQAITAFSRSIGDTKFRLDRMEPELNTAIPGDKRDTSTPAAMEKSLQQLALGNTLGSSQRELLQLWLKDNTTGNKRIRAGVAKGWIVGDKTGTGYYGTTNDIAIIWPPKCAPIVMAIYFTQNKPHAAPRDAVIAQAARILINEFAHSDQCLKSATSI